MDTHRDRLLNLLLGFALLTAALPTLIVYRAAVQPQYHWGLFGLMGRGVTPSLFVIVAAALLAWAAVVLGSLRSRAAGPLLIALNAVWFVSIVWGAILLGSRMTCAMPSATSSRCRARPPNGSRRSDSSVTGPYPPQAGPWRPAVDTVLPALGGWC